MNLTFDAEAHVYAIDGRPVPSVTQIIGDVIPRQWNATEWHLQRGRAIHEAVRLLSQGRLNWASVDERIKPRIASFQKFIADTGYKVAASEVPLGSKARMYAGTLDALVADGDELILVDYKSSVEPAVEWQLGGYSLLWSEANHGKKLKRALAVELRESGEPKLHWIKNLRDAERDFLHILSVYFIKQRHGLNNHC